MQNYQSFLFDDTYTGPRWTYAPLHRPAVSAHLPPGWIIWSDRPHPKYTFGTIDFPAPLDQHMIDAYQLAHVTK